MKQMHRVRKPSRKEYGGSNRPTRISRKSESGAVLPRTRNVKIHVVSSTTVSTDHTAEQANQDRDIKRQISEVVRTVTAEGSLQAHGPHDTNWKFATPDGHTEARNWEQQKNINSDIMQQLAEMKELLQQHAVQHEQHRTKLLEAEAQLRRLHPYSLDVRSRFLSTFKRYWLGPREITNEDWYIIDKMNIEIHEGKAYLDALLYRDRRRRDDGTYKECYGVEWQLVLKLVENSDEVEAISYRGTLRENQQLSDKLSERYNALIVAIRGILSPSESDTFKDRVSDVGKMSREFVDLSIRHIRAYRSEQGRKNRS